MAKEIEIEKEEIKEETHELEDEEKMRWKMKKMKMLMMKRCEIKLPSLAQYAPDSPANILIMKRRNVMIIQLQRN